jgi:adenosylcobinamide-GDP ribazoletransferase
VNPSEPGTREHHGDEQPSPDITAGPARRVWGLPLAVQFLTVLPWPRPGRAAGEHNAPDMAAALPWFPLVGAALGGLLALLDWALTPLFSVAVRSVLVLVVSALLTGMLHLDGFVDCCDALLGSRSVSRRLEILRDSRVGAYGALGAALLCLARFAAVESLPVGVRAFALIVAPLLGRWAVVYAVVRYPYLRQSGAGTLFRAEGARGPQGGVLALTSAIALALLLATSFAARTAQSAGFILAGLLAIVSLGVVACWAWWASRRLGGGLTGDTYGAANELVELAVLALVPPLALLAGRA